MLCITFSFQYKKLNFQIDFRKKKYMATNSNITILTTHDNITDQEYGNTSNVSQSRPYPPAKRDGRVDEHDKPFFYYGHLSIA
jgi:hypothetical protein